MQHHPRQLLPESHKTVSGGFLPEQAMPALVQTHRATRNTAVGQQHEREDLMAEAIRRAFRVQSRMPEHFHELLRRLAQKEDTASERR